MREQARDQSERALEVGRKLRAIGKLATEVAGDATAKGLQTLNFAAGSAHLPRVGVAARQTECPLSQASVALA